MYTSIHIEIQINTYHYVGINFNTFYVYVELQFNTQ